MIEGIEPSAKALEAHLLHQEQHVETPCHRQYFFVGGVYVEDTATHFGGHILKDQTYVEWLTPIGGARREFPLILVHGGGQSGMVRIEDDKCAG